MNCKKNLKMIKMKRKKRGVGNPNWKKDATEVELIKKIHNQWCRDNGYAIRGKYGKRKT